MGHVSRFACGACYIIPEFQPQALDSLRQPIESGEVAIARANHRVVYPARFQLVAAMNPCRCGHASEPGYACSRAPNIRCMAQYQGHLSGPLLDRFDLTIDVPPVTAADLLLPAPREGSAEVATRVAAARTIQSERYRALGLPGVGCNAAAPASVVEQIAELDGPASDAAERMRISARGYHRVLKLARRSAILMAAALSADLIWPRRCLIGPLRTGPPPRESGLTAAARSTARRLRESLGIIATLSQ
jgi:magnesium chelatase family protein